MSSYQGHSSISLKMSQEYFLQCSLRATFSGEIMKSYKTAAPILKLFLSAPIVLLAFQNCSRAQFVSDSNVTMQRSLGGDDGVLQNPPLGDDPAIPGSGLLGDDGMTPGSGIVDGGTKPPTTPGDEMSPTDQVCRDRYAATVPNHTPQSLCAAATTVKFMAGQHFYVGDVSFAVKNGNLLVQIALMGNVVMRESHLDIANAAADLQVSPGQFKYNMNFAPAVSQYTYSIPLSEANLAVGQSIFARVHAAVEPGQDSILCGGETAWGQGIRSGIGWSMHIPVTLSECP